MGKIATAISMLELLSNRRKHSSKNVSAIEDFSKYCSNNKVLKKTLR